MISFPCHLFLSAAQSMIKNISVTGGHFGDNQLHITLEDLLKADEQGKWWVVGSAWSGQGPRQQLGKYEEYPP